jgi:RNA polymerase sigma factor (sigma-70 family)
MVFAPNNTNRERKMQNVMHRIRRLVTRHGSDNQSDEELLRQFLREHNDEAFSMLVRRHGPMVLGVCLRLLHHRQDAEDAFQATFLTLVRKGQSIRQPGALAGWLYRVAYRVAVRARVRASKQIPQECLEDLPVDCDPASALAWSELRPVLDSELNRLPRKYRTPMILCYLEGKSYEEVAAVLGCPKGTVAVRLLRARKMLKDRLRRRGFMQAGNWAMAREALPAATALVPPLLFATTVDASAHLACGLSLGLVAPSTVAALVQEACQVFAWKKATVSLLLMLTLGITATGIKTWSYFGRGHSDHGSPTESYALGARPESPADTSPTSYSAVSDTQPVEKSPAVAGNWELAPPPAPIHSPPAAKMQQRVCISIEISGSQTTCGEPTVVLRKSISRDSVDSVVVVMPSTAPSRFHYASGLALRNQLLDDAAPECPPRYNAPPPAASVAKRSNINTFVFLQKKAIIVIESYPFFLCQTERRVIIISSATWKDLGLPQPDAQE